MKFTTSSVHFWRNTGLLASAISLVAIGTGQVSAGGNEPAKLPSVRQDDGSLLIGNTKLWPRTRKSGMPRLKRRGNQETGPLKQGFKDALDRWYHVRAFPAATYDKNRLRDAVAQRERMPITVQRTTSGGGGATPGLGTPRVFAAPGSGVGSTGQSIFVDGATWEFVGPRNAQVVPVKSGLGPANSFVTGRINEVAYNPLNPRNIFAATAGGGVWNTLDGGVNWRPLTDSAFNRIDTTSVAVHPTNPKIVLVGLGDYHGFQSAGEGIGRSTDGGQTWTIVGAGVLDGRAISDIAFDPDNPNIVIASGGRGAAVGGVYRSTDGGATWLEVTSAPGGDWSGVSIGAKPSTGGSRVYYAARQDDGVYRSTDRGVTWSRLNGVPLRYNGFAGSTGLEVAASQVDANVVYVSEGSAAALDGRIFKSTGRGDANTWTDISGQFAVRNENNGWTQVWYDHHLTTSFTTIGGQPQDVVYVGLLSVLGNIGGGVSWTNITNSYQVSLTAHTDQQGMAYNPLSPNESIITNDGGFYKAILNPTTRTWAFDKGVMNKTMGVSQFYGADWHPTNPDIMLGGTQDNSTFVSYGNLYDWRIENGGDGFSSAIHTANPNYMCSTAQGGVLHLTPNGGANWFSTLPSLTDPFPFYSVIAIVPNILGDNVDYGNPVGVRPMPIVFNAGADLWRFGLVDNNTIWQKMGSQDLGDDFITAIAVAPSNPNTVYVGTGDGKVWVTYNALAVPATDVEWFQLDVSPVRSLPTASVLAISVNPTRPQDIYVGLGGAQTEHVWRLVVQQDANGNLISGWTPQSGIQGSTTALPDAAVTTIARDPYDPSSTFYVGSDVGVFASSDNGSTWANVGRPFGLPNVPVNMLRAIPATGYLNCATFGRGMWRIKINDITGFDLALNAGVTRQTNQLRATVTATNNGNNSVTNVRIVNATMRVDGTTTNINTVTALPTVISPNLAVGSSASGAVTFQNTALVSGKFVDLNVTVQATAGTLKSVSKTFRLRIP